MYEGFARRLRSVPLWLMGWAASAGSAGASHASEPTWPALPVLARAMQALPETATLVAFHPEGANHVLLARRTSAPPAMVAQRVFEPAAYKAAVPSFARAETVATAVRPEAPGVADRLMAWELEVPLWNLEGKLWLKPFGDSIQIRFREGAFAPGQFLWRWLDTSGARGATTVVLSGTANTRDANFGTRKIAARSPLAEPAMTVAAAYATLEGLLNDGGRVPRWPRAPMQPPRAVETQLASRAASTLNHAGPIAVVLRRQDGRLDHVQVALWSALAPERAMAALTHAQTWRALPGWKKIVGTPPTAHQPAQWQIDASFPFLDFDATWEVNAEEALALRAVAVDGPGRGAVWAWQAAPARAGAPGATLLVFSLHPRLDRLGYVPRKFIEKEPLLEPGLALALAYVNAVSLARALPPP